MAVEIRHQVLRFLARAASAGRAAFWNHVFVVLAGDSTLPLCLSSDTHHRLFSQKLWMPRLFALGQKKLEATSKCGCSQGYGPSQQLTVHPCCSHTQEPADLFETLDFPEILFNYTEAAENAQPHQLLITYAVLLLW